MRAVKNILLFIGLCMLFTFCGQKNNEEQPAETKSTKQRAEEITYEEFAVDSADLVDSPASVIKDKTLLWCIDGNGLKKPSYLFGSIVSKDARAFQFGNVVLTKLAECDVAVFDNFDIDSLTPYQQQQFYLMANNQNLRAILNETDYKDVEYTLMHKIKNYKSYYLKMKPIYSLTVLYSWMDNKDKIFSVDKYLKQKAKALHKKTEQLETVFEIGHVVDKIPLTIQAARLLSLTKNYDRGVVRFDSMITLYQQQDMQAIYALQLEDEYVIVKKAMFIERNKLFLKRLLGFMQKSSVFCAVATTHLYGETGLLYQLKKLGYKVTPVFSKGPVADIEIK